MHEVTFLSPSNEAKSPLVLLSRLGGGFLHTSTSNNLASSPGRPKGEGVRGGGSSLGTRLHINLLTSSLSYLQFLTPHPTLIV